MIFIILDISESDAKAYGEVRKVIEEELARSGHGINSESP